MKFRFQPWSNRFREQLSIRRLRLWLPLVLLGILIISPFLLFGQQVEAGIDRFLVSRPPPEVVFLAVFALLMSDVVLPIPSSLVATAAGRESFVLVFVASIAVPVAAYAVQRVLTR